MKRATFTQASAGIALSFFLLNSSAIASPELPSWLNISGSINYDNTGTKTNGSFEHDYRVQDAELRFEILAREGIKLVLKAEFEKVFSKYVKDENLDLKIENMIEEAYIQIETDKVTSLPRAVVILGKQRMAFAQSVRGMPMYKDSLLYKLGNETEMLGMTVNLPQNFLKIVDAAAISLYETGKGDFEISKDKGVSIKLSKKLTTELEVTLSALSKEQQGKEAEKRGSIGLVFAEASGSWKVWTEGFVMDAHPVYKNSNYAATLGASMKLGKGTIVVESSYLESVAKEVALAYSLRVNENLILSPEVRYLMKDSGTDETVIGIRARLEYGAKPAGPPKGPRA